MKNDPDLAPDPVRTVTAPGSTLCANEDTEIRILSVDLEEGEDVEWIWNLGADGRKFVSGYRVVSEENGDS